VKDGEVLRKRLEESKNRTKKKVTEEKKCRGNKRSDNHKKMEGKGERNVENNNKRKRREE